jgi:predicted aminopeptidase
MPFYRLLRVLICLALIPGLTACTDARYYLQSVGGHLQMLQAARPIDQWLDDAQTDPALKQRLALAQRMRRFAVTELYLPDNASYHRYADVQRKAVVWNVVAAPEFSLTLKTWCFPVAGCVGYRGYFKEADALEEAQALTAQGLEVSVYGVPAYSTLGWLNWVGGDPLLNTFIHYPEGELARMIFHELAHQVVYVPDDTLFNESFATAVERLGSERWLTQYGSPQAQKEYRTLEGRRQQFRALLRSTRVRLSAIYEKNPSPDAAETTPLAMKNKAMQDFRASYAQLKTSWGGFSGYDAWVARANNAAFGAQAAYDEWVPAFEALFAQQGQNWALFYAAVTRLSQLPEAERRRTLNHLTEYPHG